ncbi:MAG TPA: F0F1 ATP synthase subunit A [Thermoanaerobaculia bacterium]|jgi:F-type H+-transporting ATPase subunit a|nr:F0F1 ATP synthase subunit A [Thermoanaerobaculia bacterium]
MLALAMLADNPLSHVIQHPLVTRPADLGALTPAQQITLLSDQIVMMIVAAVLLILFVPAMVRRRRGNKGVDALVPTGMGNALEAICQYLREEIARPVLHEHTDRFIKYVWSVFFFILMINLLGLLPIAATTSAANLGFHLGGTATANIWMTGTMALLTMLMMIVNGLRLGGKHYLAHFNPGPLWLAWLLIPIEILGLIARVAALAIRLFANMIAGHVLLAVLVGLILSAGTALGAALGVGIAIPLVAASVAVTLLEVFVAFLQAFIFAFLTALFIGLSVVFHHDDHHEEAAAH